MYDHHEGTRYSGHGESFGLQALLEVKLLSSDVSTAKEMIELLLRQIDTQTKMCV